jgi:GntR family transcriptional regulator/MocR family aminotransferase
MARNDRTDKARNRPDPPATVVRRGGGTPLTLALDPSAPVSLQRQLYGELRSAILERRLPPGARLPATRALAESLDVSRTTVALVFEQLRAEGYVLGRERAGTFVAHVLPELLLNARGSPPSSRARSQRRPSAHGGSEPDVSPSRASQRGRRLPAAPPSPSALSRRGAVLASLSISSSPLVGGNGARAFRMGTPALDHFPLPLWGRLLARQWRRVTATQLAYAEPHGYPPLRQAIAAYVQQARAVRCAPEQVIVVSGAQQAFDLAARLLLDPGDTVAVEDPGYRGMRAALAAAGAVPLPVPVDREGMDVAVLQAHLPAPRLVCVTPSHQFPLGVTLSAARRLALLEWARAHSAWIIEDDFDSEYRFRGRPLPSLQGMDDGGRVVYVGTFSKTLFPSLRLGYLIVPPALVDPFARARAVVDRHPSSLEQAVVAEFIAEGHYARHVRRMRGLYAERQAMLLQLLGGAVSGWLEGEAVDAGMHLVAWLRPGVDDVALAARALSAGIVVSPLAALSYVPPRRGALLLGFAGFDRLTMARALDVLTPLLPDAP